MPADVNHTKAVIFDCDGVLMDSVAIKTKAFRKWVKENFPQHEEEFVKYHLAFYGTNRASQLKHFYKEILCAPVSGESFNAMLKRLDTLIEHDMKDVRLMDGVEEMMETIINNNVKMFVVSGAPQGELEYHLGRLGIAKRIHGVFGAPAAKEESVKTIMESEGLAPEDLLLVGDATADAVAAFRSGIRFVHFPSEAKMEFQHVWKKIDRLKDLALYV